MALTKSVQEIIDADKTGLLAQHPSWNRIQLRDVGEILNGFPFESKDFNTSDGTPLIRIRDVSTGKSETFFSGRFDEQFLVQAGDFLVGMDGDFNCARWRSDPALLNQRVCKVTISSNFYSSRFFEYLLPGYLAAIHRETSSVTVKHLSSRTIEDIELPLPPAAEQTRIVEKLEELLSDLDAGVAELQAAQKKLAQYRQALLKAAVEGSLTAIWRETQPAPSPQPRSQLATNSSRHEGGGARTMPSRSRKGSANSAPLSPGGRGAGGEGDGGYAATLQTHQSSESGAQLLARILTERRKRWDAKQLAKFAEQGKTPPKDWQSKYAEPVTPDTTDLLALPEGWVWASLAQLAEIQGGVQKQPSRAPVANKYPFLRVANVARGLLKLDEVHEIELFEGELERLALEKGDVLIVEGNGSLSEIGRCALWDGSIENTVHQNHLIRARPVLMSCEFVETWLNSHRAIEKLTKLAATTSGLYTLSVGKISKIPVPVPPLIEQDVVTRLLADAIDEQGRQLHAVDLALKQSTAQRKNILKAAFSGQLVPQDPNDEPASVLLARIRAERAENSKAKPVAKRRKIAA